jgi:hypothetical protein
VQDRVDALDRGGHVVIAGEIAPHDAEVRHVRELPQDRAVGIGRHGEGHHVDRVALSQFTQGRSTPVACRPGQQYAPASTRHRRPPSCAGVPALVIVEIPSG